MTLKSSLLVLAIGSYIAGCSRSEKQTTKAEAQQIPPRESTLLENEELPKKFVGIWEGRDFRPDSGSGDTKQQPSWIFQRNLDGSYSFVQSIVDHERKICFRLGPKGTGEWRFRDGKLLYRSGSREEWEVRNIEWINEGEIRFKRSGEQFDYSIEKKIEEVPVVFGLGYRFVSEEEFKTR